MLKIIIGIAFLLGISGLAFSFVSKPKEQIEPYPSSSAQPVIQQSLSSPNPTNSSSNTPPATSKKTTPKPSSTSSPSPTSKTSPSPTTKPSPQPGVYKLDPSITQNIVLRLSVWQGYVAAVLLKDSNGDVIADQSDFNFEWYLADPSLVTGKVSPGGEMYGGCTGSSVIKNPCPNNNYTINYNDRTGSTTLKTKAVQKSTGKIVGETQFNITVEN